MKQVPRVKVYFSTIKENIHALGQTIFSEVYLTRCIFLGILSIIIHLIVVLHSNLQVNDYQDNTCRQKPHSVKSYLLFLKSFEL